MKKIKTIALVMATVIIATSINPVMSKAASVKLNKTKITLEVGDTQKLKVKGAKVSKVKWSSNNKKVASVKKGIVTAKKAGKANIVAKVNKKKLTCKVGVNENCVNELITPTPIPVPTSTPLKTIAQTTNNSVVKEEVFDISLNNTYLCLFLGEKNELSVIFTPNKYIGKSITWNSADDNIVSVENGMVLAKKIGTTSITAKVGNKSVQCLVTVEDPYISETSITVDVGTPKGLSVVGTAQSVEWKSSDNTIATIDKKGIITGIKQGVIKITATVNKKTFSCGVIVYNPRVDELNSLIIKLTYKISLYKSELSSLNSSLSTAQYDLNKAKSNLTKKVWNGEQWVYTADSNAVKEAQEDVDYYKGKIEEYTTQKSIDEAQLVKYQNELKNLQ